MERRMVFYIFLARFLFDRTFPQFEFKPRADPVLIEKMQKIGDSLADLKISEEAVNWMRQSQFVSCPIDASHCLHLVLKSMEMPAPSDSADDYFAAMAEHNISSQILVALMCRAPLVDPPGFVKYLKHWSRLPGFSGRCIAAISFLESAVEMIEGFAV
jgi:hypothetical protein